MLGIFIDAHCVSSQLSLRFIEIRILTNTYLTSVIYIVIGRSSFIRYYYFWPFTYEISYTFKFSLLLCRLSSIISQLLIKTPLVWMFHSIFSFIYLVTLCYITKWMVPWMVFLDIIIDGVSSPFRGYYRHLILVLVSIKIYIFHTFPQRCYWAYPFTTMLRASKSVRIDDLIHATKLAFLMISCLH